MTYVTFWFIFIN